MGGGAVYTTTTDMMNYFEILAPMVGSEDIYNQMTTSFDLNNGEVTGYGFAFSLMRKD